ncbi:hypothetical protein WAI453_000384 [Rhynchosporium graminicola]|uniref:BHLH domain-containing protein n=1 Tax=Rhynchosporium graminicola TaxID=2792576 RepID=A0A1E1JQH0_9HELO|nr:uncharacterized protein RCO7_00962 [Rhynchosporium commune]
MLAVQRHSMGSSKPPNLDMPFGYSFDNNSTFPFPSPTDPAPGPSLLDDDESRLLTNFFDGVSSEHYDYSFFDNPADGSELGHGWEELPPVFMGTTSSFGPQPQMGSHELLQAQFGDMSHINAGSSIPPSTSADVLAAASVLQNGAARSQSASNGLFGAQDLHAINGHFRAQSMSIPHPRTQAGFSQRPEHDMHEPFFTDMVFGGQPEGSMRRVGNRKADIHWGSDAGFSQGFLVAPSQDIHHATGSAYKKVVENALALNGPSSADTTQPPSPTLIKSTLRPNAIPIASEIKGDEQNSRPKKRGKSKVQEDAEEEDSSSGTAKSAKKRKSGKKAAIEIPAHESEKRRKSNAAAAAKARENLTEDQKRENHIKSEQKRRTLIREGFEEIGELVPGLRGGGFSKSAVLVMAADWLEDLIKGNEELQRRVDQLEGK